MDRSSFIKFALAGVSIATTLAAPAQTFQLNSDGYFNAGGTDVMAFSDFYPELLEFPFLWQQTEYVLGGGSSHYMFLVLAANEFQ
jgi:hypothetical protein